MMSLKRKVAASFLALVILAAAIMVTGCAKEEPAPKAPAEKKVPDTGME